MAGLRTKSVERRLFVFLDDLALHLSRENCNFEVIYGSVLQINSVWGVVVFKRITIIAMLGLLPLLSHAWGLTYRVMNASSAVVKFNSTDWLDWGTRIHNGETKYNTYYFPPKNMYLTLYNYDGSRFHITTAPGCDLVGLPPLRQPMTPVYQVQGHTVRFESGTVDIVIADLPGSNHYNKRIGCSLVVSH